MPNDEWEQKYRIAMDEVTDPDGVAVRVSTVRLAYYIGEPFETMAFTEGVESKWDNYCERYDTEDEAREGHAAMLRLIEGGGHAQ